MQRAIQSSWTDAGMISLGFFRILEIELNQRIVHPLVRRLDWDTLPRPTGRILQNLLPKIKKVRDGNTSGLELGAIYHLLNQTRDPRPDEQISQVLHDAIKASLNDIGQIAYKQGKLEDLIGDEARETYRNPPAHSRFLPLSVATACKEYVEKALEVIIEGTAKNIPAAG